MQDTEVEFFLSHLVLELDVASALNALVFLYRDIISAL